MQEDFDLEIEDDLTQEEEILLDEIDKDIALDAGDELVFPCVILHGLDTEAEFNYFRSKVIKNQALPLYCIINDSYYRVGMINFDLDTMLSLRQIFDYQLELRKSMDNSVILDLNDPETLIKFIKLA